MHGVLETACLTLNNVVFHNRDVQERLTSSGVLGLVVRLVSCHFLGATAVDAAWAPLCAPSAGGAGTGTGVGAGAGAGATSGSSSGSGSAASSTAVSAAVDDTTPVSLPRDAASTTLRDDLAMSLLMVLVNAVDSCPSNQAAVGAHSVAQDYCHTRFTFCACINYQIWKFRRIRANLSSGHISAQSARS